MPFGSVRLLAGVNVERTPTLLEAGISQSQLVRFRDGLVQKYGGWSLFYPFTISGAPRDLHAWEDLNKVNHLAIGTTTQLAVITSGSLANITPQTLVSNFSPNLSTVNGTPTVTIVDPNINTVTTFDSVFFDTPISVGGIILSGLYPIALVTGTTSYKITAATNATSTINNGGAVPVFTTVSGSAIISVALTAHGLASGNTIVFPIATTSNGVTISQAYPAVTITDANDFTIQLPNQASGSGSFSMNGGNAQLTYYISQGPAPVGSGYGLGGYGSGGYGTGTSTGSQTGTPITATDWTSDNWGELLVTCPQNGGIYYYDPTGGFATASLITQAPLFNAGMFISTGAQIMVAYGSTVPEAIGVAQDPMLVAWSDSGNFFDWISTTANLAGNFRIPFGSRIVAGLPVANQNLIWTDLDLWAMTFIGYPDTYGFNNIGAGSGAASSHAVQKLRGGVFWMGLSNFYRYDGGGVSVVQCPVWDAVFQNLNTAYLANVRSMPNTPFNEVGWLYPSAASVSGECDSYVKFNITEPNAPWDIGLLPRSAWIDQNVFGATPIAATPTGQIYAQESTPDAAGQPMTSSFTTGYFMLAEGEDFAVIDQIYPDFKWGTYAGSQGANIQLTFLITNYPSDTPTIFGPYTVTQATEYISVRMRGRQMAIQVQSADIGSFWRLGRVRYRYSADGRR